MQIIATHHRSQFADFLDPNQRLHVVAKHTSKKIPATNLAVTKEHLQVALEDGRIIAVTLAKYPRLETATRKQLLHFE